VAVGTAAPLFSVVWGTRAEPPARPVPTVSVALGRAAAPPRVHLTLQVRPVFDGAPLRGSAVALKTAAGVRISVTRLALLLSEITLRRADGTVVRCGEIVGYLDLREGRSTLELPGVPAGQYASLSFRVGLPPQFNHADPSRFPAGDPLNPQVNGLHWGWQGGYVFLALEGGYRRPDGALGGYSYHLATDRIAIPVAVTGDLRLVQDSVLDLQLDVAKAFSAVSRINPGAEGANSTHSRPGDRLAERIAANVTHAFRIVGVRAMPWTAPGLRTALRSAAVPLIPHHGGTPYPFVVPHGFPQPSLPADNPLTVEGVALGRRLFLEKRLSGNGTQACASCHQPAYAFSDRGKAFSMGIDGHMGARNAPALFNLAWNDAFTWDGKRPRLRDQALAPIQDSREMHQSLPRAVRALQGSAGYRRDFAAAFGSTTIDGDRIGRAIEQYLYTIISADSRFDRALRREAQFTDQEKRGLQLFLTENDPARGQRGGDCFHCHGGALFSDYRFHNNGLDGLYKDLGRRLVTHEDADAGKFKTPSLRNVALTAPYMHDGRFTSLEQVVAHYSEGVHRSATLDPNIAKHPDGGIHLDAADQAALVAFLKTLTDPQFARVTPGRK